MQTRLRVRRHPERGVYDPEPIHAILDEGLIAHVGFLDADSPIVIPTAYGRDGACIYLHGSAVALWCKQMAEGVPVCVTVTLMDGLVLARSTFKHSMNYRSVDDLRERDARDRTSRRSFMALNVSSNIWCPDVRAKRVPRTRTS